MSLLTAKILLAFFCLLGLAGTIVPSMPGMLLIWLAAAVFAFFTDFVLLDVKSIVILSVLAILGQTGGYLISLVGAKLAGATRRGVFGALVGAVFGLVVAGPIGLLLGSFSGAVLLELTQKDLSEALRAGLGALFGSMGGIVLEFIIGLGMLLVVFRAVF